MLVRFQQCGAVRVFVRTCMCVVLRGPPLQAWQNYPRTPKMLPTRRKMLAISGSSGFATSPQQGILHSSWTVCTRSSSQGGLRACERV